MSKNIFLFCLFECFLVFIEGIWSFYLCLLLYCDSKVSISYQFYQIFSETQRWAVASLNFQKVFLHKKRKLIDIIFSKKFIQKIKRIRQLTNLAGFQCYCLLKLFLLLKISSHWTYMLNHFFGYTETDRRLWLALQTSVIIL